MVSMTRPRKNGADIVTALETARNPTAAGMTKMMMIKLNNENTVTLYNKVRTAWVVTEERMMTTGGLTGP